MMRDTTLWWRRLLQILNGISKGPFIGADVEAELLEASHQEAVEASCSEEDRKVLAMLRGE
jgi:hypothetical protein